MQIITTAVIKGGTGKTTTAAALAQAATAAGYKVLAIDLDPQANLTYSLAADKEKAGSYELLHGEPPTIQHTAQGIDTISASPNLATEQTRQGSAMRLHDALVPIKENYSFIFIDTPPQMGELTFNALQASTGLLIPLETDAYSLQGLYQITDIAKQIQRTNKHLRILGTILTRYDNRAKINRYMQELLTEKGQEIGAPLLQCIRSGIAVRSAQTLRQSLFDYAPNSNPAQDYKELFDKLNTAF